MPSPEHLPDMDAASVLTVTVLTGLRPDLLFGPDPLVYKSVLLYAICSVLQWPQVQQVGWV